LFRGVATGSERKVATASLMPASSVGPLAITMPSRSIVHRSCPSITNR
jgi:hypothetical protein